ncbi:MAG: hypothetical protein QW530_01345 [Candidatus Micrarchaeaceae archaeon]
MAWIVGAGVVGLLLAKLLAKNGTAAATSLNRKTDRKANFL